MVGILQLTIYCKFACSQHRDAFIIQSTGTSELHDVEDVCRETWRKHWNASSAWRWQCLSNDLKVLMSYDLQNNAWTELRRMSFPRKLRHPLLVARGSRLFMNAWSDETNLSCFEVLEVFVAQNVCCRTVVQFTIAQLHDLFEEQDSEFDVAYGVPCVDSRGGCTVVVLMSSLSGKLISYELQSKVVSVLPTNPLIQDCWEQNFPAYDIFRGKNMNLSLRNLLSQADGVSVSLS